MTQTLIGVASDIFKVPPEAEARSGAEDRSKRASPLRSPEAKAPARAAFSSAAVAPASLGSLGSKTAVGVALPGIAPLNPGGVPSQAPAARTSEPSDPQRTVDQRSRLPLGATIVENPDLQLAPEAPPRPKIARSALALLVSGVGLAAAAIAFALLWNESKTLSAVVSSDERGRERIDLVCESCPDGTRVSLGGVTTEVAQLKAYLTPERPLPLGSNTLQFVVQRPDADAETVEATLPPLEYRIRANTNSLSDPQPRLSLDIEALTGSQVRIAGEPIGLDALGQGRGEVDVSSHLQGPSGEVVTFEPSVEYSVSVPEGRRYAGELKARVSVTPLVLEAPGSDTITELPRFMLAGKTAKGASISIAGNAIAVDAQGRFEQLMSIDAVGMTEVQVRANHPGLAPRFVKLRLERVASLKERAEQLASEATPMAQTWGKVAQHVGDRVEASGTVEEVRMDGRRSLILLDTGDECPQTLCWVRLDYGGLGKVRRGQRLHVIGRLVGTVSQPGTSREVPDVEVTLLQ